MLDSIKTWKGKVDEYWMKFSSQDIDSLVNRCILSLTNQSWRLELQQIACHGCMIRLNSYHPSFSLVILVGVNW